MNMKKKLVALACAGALTLGGAVPAFAADKDIKKDGAVAEVQIGALVAPEGTAIVSVTLPSTMAVAITTHPDPNSDSATPGAFKEATTPAPAKVINNAVSSHAVKISIASVSENAGPTHGQNLLSAVKMFLEGESGSKVQLATSLTNHALFNSLGVSAEGSLNLSVEAKDALTIIQEDEYVVKPILKVEAIQP